MIGRATITLGIGPHSSLFCVCLSLYYIPVKVNKVVHVNINIHVCHASNVTSDAAVSCFRIYTLPRSVPKNEYFII